MTGIPSRGPAEGLTRSAPAYALLVLVVLLAYGGTVHAGFVWDDVGHVTRPDLRGLDGLRRIWLSPGATQQYYPLLHSAFWVQHRFWGDAPGPYHAVNVALHAASVLLLYTLLRRLAVPGSLLGAALFAVHPVGVETVAWISEQKNTLSTVLALAASLLYLRFEDGRGRRDYLLASLAFALAILAKSVAVTLPAALLVVLWWKKGGLSARRDVLPLAPWLAMGAAMGACTAWVERAHIGASGAAFELGAASRVAVAGRALWFYLGKLVWPSGLCFVYPRWTIDPASAAAYLPPVLFLAALAALWAVRRSARGPLACALLFAGLLFPALGFFNAYPFLYSFVADHFQYLAMAAALPGIAAAAARATLRLPGPVRAALAGAAVACLGTLTRAQCRAYEDAEALWRATLSQNPSCWMARNNLGVILAGRGRTQEAVAQYREALAENPGFSETHNNLGVALLALGDRDGAVQQFRDAVSLSPEDVDAWNNLAKALLASGQVDAGAEAARRAVELEPRDAVGLRELGHAARLRGDMAAAALDYARAAALEPEAQTLENLGGALMALGRGAEALEAYRRAAGLDGSDPRALGNWGAALLALGRPGQAAPILRRAVALAPASADLRLNLGQALLGEGDVDGAIAELRRAVTIAPGDRQAHGALAAALFRKGLTDEALSEIDRSNTGR